MTRLDIRYCDDWEALYVDGVLYEENHSLNWRRLLVELSGRLGTCVTAEPIDVPEDFDDSTHYIDFADRLEDIAVGRYDV